MTAKVSEIFDPSLWQEVEAFSFSDITYHRAKDVAAVRIAFNRPEVRNAFRPQTVDELYAALDHARQSSDVGAVIGVKPATSILRATARRLIRRVRGGCIFWSAND